MKRKTTNLLLTGKSGVGKSTILGDVAAQLEACNIRGFISNVIYRNDVRQGWQLQSLDGVQGVVAHTNIQSANRMGEYGVDMAMFERITAPQMVLKKDADLYLIDEIGIIASWSPRFVKDMNALLASSTLVIAIVRQKGQGYNHTVIRRSDVEVYEITEANRDGGVGNVLGWIGEYCMPNQPLKRNWSRSQLFNNPSPNKTMEPDG